MNCLCGYNRMDKGTVTVNGLDLYNNYDNLKTMIGYVPQSDIVYRELSLQSMLLYSARLRLPKDSLQEELQASVDRVLKQVELSDHRSTLIGRLSGGQRKRASIAVELLSDPQLFFLDEPMSGLDPGTEKHLMKILRQMSRQGKTIIMVTHSTLNLAMFDQILFMGRGGNLCYAGPLQDALNYFKVEDVVDVYQLIDSRGTEYGDRYRQQFLGDRPFIESADQLDATSSYYSRPAAAMQSQKQQPADTAKVAAGKGGGNTAGKLKKSNKGTFFIQLSVLTRRYFELQINDRVRLLINLIQPVLLAVLLALVASDTVFEQYESTKSLLCTYLLCLLDRHFRRHQRDRKGTCHLSARVHDRLEDQQLFGVQADRSGRVDLFAKRAADRRLCRTGRSARKRPFCSSRGGFLHHGISGDLCRRQHCFDCLSPVQTAGARPITGSFIAHPSNPLLRIGL